MLYSVPKVRPDKWESVWSAPLAALLFDLDGTLAETDSLHLLAWAHALRLYGVKIDEDFYKKKISGRLNPDVVDELLPELPPTEARKLIETKEANFLLRARDLVPLPGLLNLIEDSHKEGLRLALVTNAPKDNASAILKALNLDGVFDPVVLASNVGVGKPDPALYESALGHLELNNREVLAFEDSPSGIASAVGANIATVGIASTHVPSDLQHAGAGLVVENFTDPRLLALVAAGHQGSGVSPDLTRESKR